MILTLAASTATFTLFVRPQIETAIASGITTMIGGGTGPATGNECHSWSLNIHRMLQAADAFPVNLGFGQRQQQPTSRTG